jgi:hypothetical protein
VDADTGWFGSEKKNGGNAWSIDRWWGTTVGGSGSGKRKELLNDQTTEKPARKTRERERAGAGKGREGGARPRKQS